MTNDTDPALLAGLVNSPLSFVSSDWVEYLPEHPHAEESAAVARRMFDAFFGRP